MQQFSSTEEGTLMPSTITNRDVDIDILNECLVHQFHSGLGVFLRQ